jgi:hypothetical protein
MPLRDHFRPTRRRWHQIHALWPGFLLARLEAAIPPGYEAGPSIRVGAEYELDVGTVDTTDPGNGFEANGSGGTTTATLTAPPPTLTATGTDLAGEDQFALEVRDPEGTLVAAVEFISPRNLDRPSAREAFAAKCATLVRHDVCVAVVDVVTDRTANLYASTLDQLGVTDPALGAEPPAIYAATLRRRTAGRKHRLDAWGYPLDVGQPIPSLPLWLTDDLWLTLDLEGSYEEVCRILHIR